MVNISRLLGQPLSWVRQVQSGRRNLARSELTFLEATYFETVIGFDRWVETERLLKRLQSRGIHFHALISGSM